MIKYSITSFQGEPEWGDYTHLHVYDNLIKDFSFSDSEETAMKLKSMADKGGSVLFAEREGRNMVFLSAGPLLETHSAENVFRLFFFRNVEILNRKILLDFSILGDRIQKEVLYNAIKGIFLSVYKVSEWRDENIMDRKEYKIEIKADLPSGHLDEVIKEAEVLACTQMRIMRLVDMPSNFKTPQYIRDFCIKLARKNELEIEVIENEEVKEKRLFALEAVGRGSENPPLMIIMRYKSGNIEAPHLGLAGKGVTFDTGGISIKPSANLHMMKSDMGGAAAVIGAIDVISTLGLEIDITAVIPLTENCVDAKSIKPGDVISSRAGKTIEIIDTDAEGRLILADALFYLKEKFNPDFMIDLATLTGSAVRTFGYECAALFSNNPALAAALGKAGENSGERVWPLPLWKEYESGIKSDVADVANFSGKPVNGAIDAALFLKSFTDDHEKWAHLDIAGVAFKASEYSNQRSATGYGVNLLLSFAKKLSMGKM